MLDSFILLKLLNKHFPFQVRSVLLVFMMMLILGNIIFIFKDRPVQMLVDEYVEENSHFRLNRLSDAFKESYQPILVATPICTILPFLMNRWVVSSKLKESLCIFLKTYLCRINFPVCEKLIPMTINYSLKRIALQITTKNLYIFYNLVYWYIHWYTFLISWTWINLICIM